MNAIGFLQNNLSNCDTKISTIVPINFTHSCAIGETGCGKTTSYIYPNLDERIKNNHSILMYDYKGKEHLALKTIAKKHNKLENVIEIGVPWGKKINLLKYMNEAEVRKFVINIVGLTDKDPYWSTSAANIVVSIFKVYKEHIDILNEVPKKDKKKFNFGIDTNLLKELTFATIATIVKDVDSIVEFVETISDLIAVYKHNFESLLLNSCRKDTDEIAKERYQALLEKILIFENNFEKYLEPLDIFMNSSRKSSTFESIILSMSTTFATISSIDAFNKDELDIVKELNNGKIIVINTQELSSSALSAFSASLFQELSKRVTVKNKNGISIFIDEAQRVLTGEFDLYEDVLREAKVELFLAFQNHSLMIESLGENNFIALYQNLSSRFHFRNNIAFKEIQTDELSQFEFLLHDDDTKHVSNKIFLNNDELFTAQQEYLRVNNIYKKYALKKYMNKYILLFNPYIFKQNKLMLEDKKGNTIIVPIRNIAIEIEVNKYMKELLKKSKKSFLSNRKVEINDEEQTLTDIILGVRAS